MKIDFPFIVCVGDYHEFDGILHLLNCLSDSKVKYMELEMDRYPTYSAIFYSGKKPSKETILKTKYVEI